MGNDRPPLAANSQSSINDERNWGRREKVLRILMIIIIASGTSLSLYTMIRVYQKYMDGQNLFLYEMNDNKWSGHENVRFKRSPLPQMYADKFATKCQLKNMNTEECRMILEEINSFASSIKAEINKILEVRYDIKKPIETEPELNHMILVKNNHNKKDSENMNQTIKDANKEVLNSTNQHKPGISGNNENVPNLSGLRSADSITEKMKATSMPDRDIRGDISKIDYSEVEDQAALETSNVDKVISLNVTNDILNKNKNSSNSSESSSSEEYLEMPENIGKSKLSLNNSLEINNTKLGETLISSVTRHDKHERKNLSRNADEYYKNSGGLINILSKDNNYAGKKVLLKDQNSSLDVITETPSNVPINIKEEKESNAFVLNKENGYDFSEDVRAAPRPIEDSSDKNRSKINGMRSADTEAISEETLISMVTRHHKHERRNFSRNADNFNSERNVLFEPTNVTNTTPSNFEREAKSLSLEKAERNSNVGSAANMVFGSSQQNKSSINEKINDVTSNLQIDEHNAILKIFLKKYLNNLVANRSDHIEDTRKSTTSDLRDSRNDAAIHILTKDNDYKGEKVMINDKNSKSYKKYKTLFESTNNDIPKFDQTTIDHNEKDMNINMILNKANSYNYNENFYAESQDLSIYRENHFEHDGNEERISDDAFRTGSSPSTPLSFVTKVSSKTYIHSDLNLSEVPNIESIKLDDIDDESTRSLLLKAEKNLIPLNTSHDRNQTISSENSTFSNVGIEDKNLINIVQNLSNPLQIESHMLENMGVQSRNNAFESVFHQRTEQFLPPHTEDSQGAITSENIKSGVKLVQSPRPPSSSPVLCWASGSNTIYQTKTFPPGAQLVNPPSFFPPENDIRRQNIRQMPMMYMPPMMLQYPSSGQYFPPHGIPGFPSTEGQPTVFVPVSSMMPPLNQPYKCTYSNEYSLQPNIVQFRTATNPPNKLNNLTNVEDDDVNHLSVHYKDMENLATKIYSNHSKVESRNSNCAIGQSSCADGTCYESSMKCDGIVQCPDASDETHCPCKARIDKSRICDGFFDCPLGEDELGCGGCGPLSFSCSEKSKERVDESCFTIEQRCDGNFNCPNRIDENECTMLNDRLEHHAAYSVTHSRGFLHKNHRGKWFPVCENPYEWAKDACAMESFDNKEAPFIKLVPKPEYFKGTFIQISQNGNIEFTRDCFNGHAFFVMCPQPKCGYTSPTVSQTMRKFDYEEDDIYERRKRHHDKHKTKVKRQIHLDPVLAFGRFVENEDHENYVSYDELINGHDISQGNYYPEIPYGGNYEGVNYWDNDPQTIDSYMGFDPEMVKFEDQVETIPNQFDSFNYEPYVSNFDAINSQRNDYYYQENMDPWNTYYENSFQSNYLPNEYYANSYDNFNRFHSSNFAQEPENFVGNEDVIDKPHFFELVRSNNFNNDFFKTEDESNSLKDKTSKQSKHNNPMHTDQKGSESKPKETFTTSNSVDVNITERIDGTESSQINRAPDIENSTAKVNVSNEEPIVRVVGGKLCEPAEWPWVVAIYKDGVFTCGGTLIDEQWVLTAAHCMEKFWKHYYEVQAGMLRRLSFSPQEQAIPVSHAIVHEEYDKVSMNNDLALLKLQFPVIMNRWIRPACLPKESSAGHNWKWGPLPGIKCSAVGWGATEEKGPDPDHLRKVEVPIMANCITPEDKAGKEICAGYQKGGKDACQGDSGGPLLCKNPHDPRQYYVAGIVSHGEGCARPNEPGVYTRVSIYMDWIKNSMVLNSFPSRRPKQKCPGFSCKFGVQRCLPKKRRCDKVVDCLGSEDEINCENDIVESVKRSKENNNVSEEDHSNEKTEKMKSSSEVPHIITNIIDMFDDLIAGKVLRPNAHINDTDNKTVISSAKSKPTAPIKSRKASESEIDEQILEDPIPNLTLRNRNNFDHVESSGDFNPLNDERLINDNVNMKVLIDNKDASQNFPADLSNIPFSEKPLLGSHQSASDMFEGMNLFGNENLENTDELARPKILAENQDAALPPISDNGNMMFLSKSSSTAMPTSDSGIKFDQKPKLLEVTNGFDQVTQRNFLSTNVLEIKTNHPEDEAVFPAFVNSTENLIESESKVSPIINHGTEISIVENQPDSDEMRKPNKNISVHSTNPMNKPGGPAITKDRFLDETTLASRRLIEDISTLENKSEGFEIDNDVSDTKVHPITTIIKISTKLPRADENENTHKIGQTNVLAANSGNNTNTHFTGLELITDLPTTQVFDHPHSHVEKKDLENDFSSMSVPNTTVKQIIDDRILPLKTIDRLEIKNKEKNSELQDNKLKHFIKHKLQNKDTPHLQEVTLVKRQKLPSLYKCKMLSQSIPMSRRCDHNIDCEDGSDELDCSCSERLQFKNPKLICDGYVDCADGSDELGCFVCPEGHSHCVMSRQCVPNESICDLRKDCTHGEDEMDCYRFLSSIKMKCLFVVLLLNLNFIWTIQKPICKDKLVEIELGEPYEKKAIFPKTWALLISELWNAQETWKNKDISDEIVKAEPKEEKYVVSNIEPKCIIVTKPLEHIHSLNEMSKKLHYSYTQSKENLEGIDSKKEDYEAHPSASSIQPTETTTMTTQKLPIDTIKTTEIPIETSTSKETVAYPVQTTETIVESKYFPKSNCNKSCVMVPPFGSSLDWIKQDKSIDIKTYPKMQSHPAISVKAFPPNMQGGFHGPIQLGNLPQNCFYCWPMMCNSHAKSNHGKGTTDPSVSHH